MLTWCLWIATNPDSSCISSVTNGRWLKSLTSCYTYARHLLQKCETCFAELLVLHVHLLFQLYCIGLQDSLVSRSVMCGILCCSTVRSLDFSMQHDLMIVHSESLSTRCWSHVLYVESFQDTSYGALGPVLHPLLPSVYIWPICHICAYLFLARVSTPKFHATLMSFSL